MNSLEKMFPSLTKFSDLNWATVTQEYEENYIDLSFPEYLQQKALDGDCPPYLFELAFYELALFDVTHSDDSFPFQPGIYLNPTALFLSLEFDVKKMIEDASQGTIEVIERAHVLCLYRDKKDKTHIIEMTEEELELLQNLEDGHQNDLTFLKKDSTHLFEKLKKQELIIDLLST